MFYLILLNKSMNNYDSIKLTNNWLRDNGLDPKTMAIWSKELVQAQMIASNLLKHHAHQLDAKQTKTLLRFLSAVKNRKAREKIKKGTCYQVMNIGTSINRMLFKRHRKTK